MMHTAASRSALLAVACAASLTTVLACDALVGGECNEGFEAIAGSCAPITGTAVPHGGAGGATGGAGGEGGSTSSTVPTGGSGGQGGAIVCDDGLTACPVGCVDLQSHPHNCGGCNHVCPSGICEDGECVGDTAGHVVMLSMNYEESTASSRRLLGNAAFLSLNNPVRVLDYRRFAVPESYVSVQGILEEQAAIRARSLHIRSTDRESEILSLAESEHDVFVLHDQELAPKDWGSVFGAAVKTSLLEFINRGGTVIALATTDAPEMVPLANTLGLFRVDGVEPMAGELVTSETPTDVVSIGVPVPFLAKTTTSVFAMGGPATSTLTFVMSEAESPWRPVAIHKAILVISP